jgi:hypothetical protein
VLRPLAGMPERDGRMVEDRRQLLLQPRPPELDRRSFLGLGQHPDARRAELDSSGSLGRGDRVALQVEDCLRLQLCKRGAQTRLVHDDLREPAPVTEDEERHAAQPPLVVEPARYAHARPDVAGKLVRENALHRNHLLHTSPPGADSAAPTTRSAGFARAPSAMTGRAR